MDTNKDEHRDKEKEGNKEKEGKRATIYNYKLSDEFIVEMFRFSKIHQYDSREDFKDAWVEWTEENVELIEYESRRLVSIGYVGNINNKMYKSARYYFRTKKTEKKPPIQRREYVTCLKALDDSIHEHLRINMSQPDFKPATYFKQFLNEHKEVVQMQIEACNDAGITDIKEIQCKINKTYKNRYYVMSH